MFINSEHPLFWPMVAGTVMWLCGLLILPMVINIPGNCLCIGWGVFLFGLATAFIRHPGE